MKPLAWALLAVSSEAQAETLEFQRDWAAECAKQRGWRIGRYFEGVATGKHGPRRLLHDVLTELIALPEKKRPEWLLMIRLDRVGRGSAFESGWILHRLKQLGVRVFTRDSGEERIDSAMEQFMAFGKLVVAEHENEVRKDKAKAVYRRKRAAGLAVGNQRPYGLRIENGKDVKDGELAKVVSLAFKLRAQGLGLHVIGLRLAEVAPPRKYKSPKKRATEHVVRWTPTRVLRLLQNRAYIGPVVTELEFRAANRVRSELGPDQRKRKYPWPLSGAMRCFCGRAMIGMISGGKEYRTRYYACRAVWAHDGHIRLVRADALEEQFVAILQRLHASPKTIAKYRKEAAHESLSDLGADVKRARRELAAVEKERERAWDLHARGLVRDADLQPRLDALTEKREALEARIHSLEEREATAKTLAAERSDVAAAVRDIAQNYRRVNAERQREAARAVALMLGGLCVDEAGKLLVKRVEDNGRQRARHAGEC